MNSLLETVSSLSTPFIAVACAVHVGFFLVLWVWYRRDLRGIASTLDAFTREIRHRSVLDATGHLSDQIHAFLTDINEILENPSREPDRARLLERISILDERRSYLQSLWFETSYNAARTMIEAYPLLGVLGTILAIGVVLGSGSEADPTVGALVTRFGEAIWSTFAGLIAAILLMFLNSLLETPFSRLTENREQVRDTVVRVKRALSLREADAA